MTQEANNKLKNKTDAIGKAVERLQAYYDCNHEVMDADDIGDLLTTIHELKTIHAKLIQTANNTTVELIPEYAHDHDRTYIMEATYVGRECISMECVGWYCGEPNEDDTKYHANRQMKAEFLL